MRKGDWVRVDHKKVRWVESSPREKERWGESSLGEKERLGEISP